MSLWGMHHIKCVKILIFIRVVWDQNRYCIKFLPSHRYLLPTFVVIVYEPVWEWCVSFLFLLICIIFRNLFLLLKKKGINMFRKRDINDCFMAVLSFILILLCHFWETFVCHYDLYCFSRIQTTYSTLINYPSLTILCSIHFLFRKSFRRRGPNLVLVFLCFIVC